MSRDEKAGLTAGPAELLGQLQPEGGLPEPFSVEGTPLACFAVERDVLDWVDDYIETRAVGCVVLASEAMEQGDWHFGLFDRLLVAAMDLLDPAEAERILVRYPDAADVIVSDMRRRRNRNDVEDVEVAHDAVDVWDNASHGGVAVDRAVEEGVLLLQDALRAVGRRCRRRPLVHLRNLHRIDRSSQRLLQCLLENVHGSAFFLVMCSGSESSPERTVPAVLRFAEALADIVWIDGGRRHLELFTDLATRRAELTGEQVAGVLSFAKHGIAAAQDLTNLLINHAGRRDRAGYGRWLQHLLAGGPKRVLECLLEDLSPGDRARAETLALANWHPRCRDLDAAVSEWADAVPLSSTWNGSVRLAGESRVTLGRRWKSIISGAMSAGKRKAIAVALTTVAAGTGSPSGLHGALVHLSIESGAGEFLSMRAASLGSRFFERVHDSTGAIAFYRRALGLVDDKEMKTTLLARLVEACIRRSEMSAAARYYRQAIRLRYDCARTAILCHEYAMAVGIRQGDPEGASRILRDGALVAGRLPDRDERHYAKARINNGRALILYRREDSARAEKRLRLAERFLDAISSERRSLRAYGAVVQRNLATVAGHSGDTRAFLAHHRRAAEIGAQTGRADHVAWSLLATGMFHLKFGDSRTAGPWFERALDACLGARVSMPSFAKMVADLYVQENSPEQALYFVGRRAAYYRERGLGFGELRVWLGHSVAFRAAGMRRESDACMAASVRVSRTVSAGKAARMMVGEVARSLPDMAHSSGEAERG